MLKLIAALSVALSFPNALAAQDRLSIIVNDSYEDMMVAVEKSILNQGLVIDSISQIGAMLNQTTSDTGAEADIFQNASVYNFCSPNLMRQAATIDPTNIVYCPYNVYVFTTTEDPDKTTIGVPIYLYPEMTAVNELLRDIIIDASKF